LIAAYLASYNPARTDQTFFTKLHEKKKRRRKANNTGTTKSTATSKHRKIQRKLLGPQPFNLERLLAIFHAIVLDKAPAGSGDVLTQIATLASLRMLVRAASGGTRDGFDDGVGAKWRVNVGWEYVCAIAKKVEFEIEDFVAE
jgi:origin recognition complex subunit 5